MNRYYVYVYLDPRKPGVFIYDDLKFNFEPIYIGKGTGYRISDHVRNAKKTNKNSPFLNLIRKLVNQNLTPINYKLIESISQEEAKRYEVAYIKLIGRKDLNLGPLLNLTDGADGCYNFSSDIKQKMSDNNWLKGNGHLISGDKNPMYGVKLTEAERLDKIKIIKNSWLNKDVRTNRINGIKKAYADGRMGSAEHKFNLSQSQKRKYIITGPDGIEYTFHGSGAINNFINSLNEGLNTYSPKRVSYQNLIKFGSNKGWQLISQKRIHNI